MHKGSHGKMVGDPAPSGSKRGIEFRGESKATKALLAHAGKRGGGSKK